MRRRRRRSGLRRAPPGRSPDRRRQEPGLSGAGGDPCPQRPGRPGRGGHRHQGTAGAADAGRPAHPGRRPPGQAAAVRHAQGPVELPLPGQARRDHGRRYRGPPRLRRRGRDRRARRREAAGGMGRGDRDRRPGRRPGGGVGRRVVAGVGRPRRVPRCGQLPRRRRLLRRSGPGPGGGGRDRGGQHPPLRRPPGVGRQRPAAPHRRRLRRGPHAGGHLRRRLRGAAHAVPGAAGRRPGQSRRRRRRPDPPPRSGGRRPGLRPRRAGGGDPGRARSPRPMVPPRSRELAAALATVATLAREVQGTLRKSELGLGGGSGRRRRRPGQGGPGHPPARRTGRRHRPPARPAAELGDLDRVQQGPSRAPPGDRRRGPGAGRPALSRGHGRGHQRHAGHRRPVRPARPPPRPDAAAACSTSRTPTDDSDPAGSAGSDVEPTPPVHRALTVPSPFDHARQGWLYVAKHLPEPNDPRFAEAMADELHALITAAGGRTLALFTSRAAMDRTADALAARGGYEVLVQDRLPRPELLARFRAGPGLGAVRHPGLLAGRRPSRPPLPAGGHRPHPLPPPHRPAGGRPPGRRHRPAGERLRRRRPAGRRHAAGPGRRPADPHHHRLRGGGRLRPPPGDEELPADPAGHPPAPAADHRPRRR